MKFEPAHEIAKKYVWGMELKLGSTTCQLFFWDGSSINHIAHLRQGFDIEKEPVLHDITLVLGFINSLALILRVKHCGLAWLAIPCQSFTCMSYSQHRRSNFNPYGCWFYPFIVRGNEICTRTCLLILVAIARSVTWFVENPLRSALHTWPYVNHLMSMPWLRATRSSWWGPYIMYDFPNIFTL